MRQLSDDELIDLIEQLSSEKTRPVELDPALAELFSRMRAEAPLGKEAWVEAVIGRLTGTFAQDEDEDGPSGVREPRRTPPGSNGGAIRLAS